MEERIKINDNDKKYWIITYIPVFNYPESPEDEDAYFETKEEAESEVKHMEFLQPDNLYFVVEKEDDGSEVTEG